MDNLAHYYLEEITCARTFRQAKIGESHKDYAKDLQSRFGYLKSMTRDWKVNGAILLLVRYCDPFAFEMPGMKDYLDGIGIPSTYIEYDHTMGSLAPLRTRVEAFLETIG
jgi:benzoyl-CoA reductase/2-hydroxyglutaryl-CoA dehydratase subunit BcrC/BadD/HgdB